jgi:hypothetical protein
MGAVTARKVKNLAERREREIGPSLRERNTERERVCVTRKQIDPFPLFVLSYLMLA